nr:MAG TPA: hypothetical protein [Caudoviricetes sp.]
MPKLFSYAIKIPKLPVRKFSLSCANMILLALTSIKY